MDYFDGTYFDGTYFDTVIAAATTGGGARRSTSQMQIIPQPEPVDSEDWITLLL